MTVGIREVAVMHKTKILGGIDVCRAAIYRSRLIHRIDGLTAVARQCKHHFAGSSWRNRTVGEASPLGVSKQHDIDRLAPYHARRRIVSEMRVVQKTEGLVESHRPSEIA